MDTWLPEGQHARRNFIVLVVLACIALALVRFFVVPPLFGADAPSARGVLDETLGNLIATALAGTGLALGLLWMFPAPRRPAIVESLPAHEIGARLESAFATANRWWFDGSTGRYQRARTLPEMARLARQDGLSREVTIVVLDPQDEGLCRRYASYRRGLDDTEWSVDRVRRDLYATILAAHRHSQTSRLNVTLAVKGTMSILRYDLCDSQLVITKEGSADPAIYCPAESFYYRAYLEQLIWSLKQARVLDLTGPVLNGDDSASEAARAVLRALGVETPSLDSDTFVNEVIALAESRKQPYA